MDQQSNRKRVVCPVATKDGKTYWLRMGTAFVNKDSSINLYLDCLPVNGKLQVRDWDDPPWEKRDGAALGAALQARAVSPAQDEMPF